MKVAWTLALLLLWTTAADAQVLKLATVAPEGSVWHTALREMAEAWRAITAGTLETRIYPGGVAGDDADVIRKMRIGQIGAAALTADGMAAIAPEMRIFQTPMLIQSEAELDYLRGRLEGELETIAERRGFVLLAWCDVGWVYLFAKTPVADVESARRVRLWIAPGDTAWATALQSAGYRPVALPTTEILSGLQTGLIDAFNAPPVVALSSQWFGVAPHLMNLRWSPLVGAVVVSSRAWDAVPEEQRAQLRRAARTATARAQAEIRKFERDAIVAMQKHGLQVHDVAPSAAEAFRADVRRSYAKIVGPSIPEGIFEEATAYLGEFRGGN
jgi:TRAP-type C4-dicarboxylate transport system substrate-binding protein